LDEACQVKQVIKQREQRLAACASVCDSERGAFQGRGTVKTIDTGKTRGHLTIALALLVLVTRFQAGFATRECSYSLPSLRFERVARGSTRGVSLSTSCPDMTEQRQTARPGHVCGGRIRQTGEQVDRWTGGRVDGWTGGRTGVMAGWPGGTVADVVVVELQGGACPMSRWIVAHVTHRIHRISSYL
jgi:hypothetical protein